MSKEKRVGKLYYKFISERSHSDYIPHEATGAQWHQDLPAIKWQSWDPGQVLHPPPYATHLSEVAHANLPF